jgi:signal transduction histidine kinase
MAFTGTDLRTLVYTPTGKDGRLIAALLERQDMECQVATCVEQVCASIRMGAGAAIFSEEAFAGNSLEPLLETLRCQPSWSDFPVVLLTVSGRVTVESERLRELRRPLGNLFLLERPIRPETLLSTLEIALRGRQRQYQIRDQIRQVALAQEALLRSEKLAVTGRLAASIAHEINNPLEAITNLLFLLARSLDDTEVAAKYLDSAQAELDRVSRIARQILSFNRESKVVVEVSLSEILDDVLALNNRALVEKNIEVIREWDMDLRIQAFPAQLRQVFSNLIRNATEASHPGKALRVRISGYPRRNSAENRVARVTISDQGVGIPAHHLSRIFDAFFTTKELKGSGIGLWLSSAIVQEHRGRIAVRSSTHPSRSGTCISVVLPCELQSLPPSAQA